MDDEIKSVCKVRHKPLGIYRIIKKVKSDSLQALMLENESRILTALSSVDSSVPTILDVGRDGDFLYIIEDYMEGQSLKSFISDHFSIDISQKIDIFLKICRSVQTLHSQKVLHLDIKPENIIIGDKCVSLIDFGNALIKGEKRRWSAGTPKFAPPQLLKEGRPDERTDIYSLGKVLLFMLTGDADDMNVWELSQRKDRRLNYLSSVIFKCIEQNPKKRYRYVNELIKSISIYEEGEQKAITIGVTGVKHGIGATYVALALAKAMTERGLKAYYKECNDSEDAFAKMRHKGLVPDRYGIYIDNGCHIMPAISDGVALETGDYDICICDFGVFGEDISEGLYKSDKVVIVGGDSDMTVEKTQLLFDHLSSRHDAYLVVNFSSKTRFGCVTEFGERAWPNSYRGNLKEFSKKLYFRSRSRSDEIFHKKK